MSKINYSEKRKKDVRKIQSFISVVILFLLFITLIHVVSYLISNRPIERSEAVSLSGSYDEHYESSDDHEGGVLYLEDGTRLIINPYIYFSEDLGIQSALDSLKKGTNLQLLINPNNNYVMEIRTDNNELLTYDEYSDTMEEKSNIILTGTVVCIIILICLCYTIVKISIVLYKYLRKPDSIIKEIERTIDPSELVETKALRHADYNDNVKIKVRLEATDDTYRYRIQYRRRKSTNELVVNDWVYDDKKCLLEQEHTLSAVVDGHLIEAGIIDDSAGFIMFDGKLINYNSSLFLLLN